MRPLAACAQPGCSARVSVGYCPEHQQARTVEHGRYKRGATNYSLRRYRRERARFLAANPVCIDCIAEGGRIEPATELDHRTPHRGDLGLFWDRSNWAARCARHHSQKTYRETIGSGKGTNIAATPEPASRGAVESSEGQVS